MPIKKSSYHFFDAWGIYFIAAIIAFLPCLVRGYVYFDNDLLDIYGISRLFLKNSLCDGHLPFWNPYLFGGQPFMADPAAMSFYPLQYPTLFFPFVHGTNTFYILHLILAGAGMHFWLRNLDLSKESCWIGSFALMLSGFFWCEINHPNILSSLAWIPWFLGFLERFARAPKASTAFLAGLFFSIQFLASGLGITLGTLYLGFAYFCFRVIGKTDRSENASSKKIAGNNWKTSLILFLFFSWGCLPLFVLWLPAFEFINYSGLLHRKAWYQIPDPGLSLNPNGLFQFLFPIRSIDLASGATLSNGSFVSNYGFLGIWAPFLALITFRRLKEPLTIFLAVSGVFSLFVCFGKHTPIYHLICDWLPGFGLFRSPFRFSYIYVICFSALSAIGYEELLPQKAEGKGVLRNNALWIFAYALILLRTSYHTGHLAWDQLFFLGLGVFGFLLWLRSKNWNRLGRTLFLISAFSSLLIGAWTCCSSRSGPSSNLDYAKEKPLIEKIKERVGFGRVFVGDNIPYPITVENKTSHVQFPANASCLFGLQNMGGDNPFSLNQRGELYSVPFKTFIRLMSIQGFATGNEKGDVPGFIRHEWDGVKFYESKDNRPLVYAPSKVTIITNDNERLNTMRRGDFNPYEQAYLSEAPPSEMVIGERDSKKKFNYTLIQAGLNQRVFEIKLDRPSWVVFSDPNYPGWKARVDEKPIRVFTANHMFRGIFIPAGEH